MSVPKGWTARGIDYRFSGTFIGAIKGGEVHPFKVSGANDSYVVGIVLGEERTSQLLYRNAMLTYPKLGVVQMDDEAYWVHRSAAGYKRGVDVGRLGWVRIGTYPNNVVPRISGNALRPKLLQNIFNPEAMPIAEAEQAILAGTKAGVRISPSLAVAAMRGYIDPGLYYNNTLVGYVREGTSYVARTYDYVGEEIVMLGNEVRYA